VEKGEGDDVSDTNRTTGDGIYEWAQCAFIAFLIWFLSGVRGCHNVGGGFPTTRPVDQQIEKVNP
jgi:hypothetical protein